MQQFRILLLGSQPPRTDLHVLVTQMLINPHTTLTSVSASYIIWFQMQLQGKAIKKERKKKNNKERQKERKKERLVERSCVSGKLIWELGTVKCYMRIFRARARVRNSTSCLAFTLCDCIQLL